MHPLIKAIFDEFDDSGCIPKCENSVLELASMALEAKVAGLDIAPLGTVWRRHLSSCRIGPGKFKRSPTDPKANSHDNWVGLAACSHLFDYGKTAREILDHLEKGFIWKTSQKLDAEWFVKPDNLRIMQIAARTHSKFPKNKLNDAALAINLRVSKDWNVRRVTLLMMASVFGRMVGITEKSAKQMGISYRGRYGGNVIYLQLWALNKGRYL